MTMVVRRRPALERELVGEPGAPAGHHPKAQERPGRGPPTCASWTAFSAARSVTSMGAICVSMVPMISASGRSSIEAPSGSPPASRMACPDRLRERRIGMDGGARHGGRNPAGHCGDHLRRSARPHGSPTMWPPSTSPVFASATTLTCPAGSPSRNARVTSENRAMPTATPRPSLRASSSVRPTLATSGSQNVTRGTTR